MKGSNSIERKSIITHQKELSGLIGCPGHEEEVAGYLQNKLEGKADKVWTDGLGSVLAVKEGTGSGPRRRILLDCHMDEVGFIITHVDDRGFLRIESLGGVDSRLVMGSLLRFRSDSGAVVEGIVGSMPPHITSPEERKKVPELKDLFVDLGMPSRDHVQRSGLHIGSVGTFAFECRLLDDDTIIGKAFDDRTGCNVLLHVLYALSERDHDDTVVFSFSSQEEVGLRGAGAAAYAHEPDAALAIENTVASDVPGVPAEKVVTELGAGPAITTADHSHIVPRRIVERLRRAAEEEGIPWQYKKPMYGGTDAAKIAQSRTGVPTGILSVPSRYIHGPSAMVRIDDIVLTARLALAFCTLGW